ncbi:MAG TPA: hypothetical protein VF435_03900 [Pyrinomonadaceae bacterium]
MTDTIKRPVEINAINGNLHDADGVLLAVPVSPAVGAAICKCVNLGSPERLAAWERVAFLVERIHGIACAVNPDHHGDARCALDEIHSFVILAKAKLDELEDR